MNDRSDNTAANVAPGAAIGEDRRSVDDAAVASGRSEPGLARCVMVLGTTSGAGKSWLVTALCRWYARQGLRVAPFKAQNMSNNARVVAGGEIGSAQYFQALAAGVEPTVQMNPLLLKPEADTRSQVILLGQVNEALTAMAWRERHVHTWPVISQALDELRSQYDVIVIEGAGSPAEINLHSTDVVNLRVARHVDAACLLVSDIDRGGAFAHLYGTWALMPEADRRLLRGFVLNRFRGDASLLAPAPQIIEEKTGVPVVATVPMWTGHGLPEEDGWFRLREHWSAPGASAPMAQPDRQAEPGGQGASQLDSLVAGVAIGRARDEAVSGLDDHATISDAGSGDTLDDVTRILLVMPPRISNLDEFEQLAALRKVQLQVVRDGRHLPVLQTDDWIILPGSKHTSSDLAWLRAQGIDRWVQQHAARGGRVLGICGGMQMLGEQLRDPHGVDGAAPGLGLLPLSTTFAPDKVLRRHAWQFRPVPGAWSALSGLRVTGYEIHQGQTEVSSPDGGSARASRQAADQAQLIVQNTATGMGGDMEIGMNAGQGQEQGGSAAADRPGIVPILPDRLGWSNAQGNVLGLYLHGIFENDAVLTALFGQQHRPWEHVFDGLADHVSASFVPGVLKKLIGY